MKGLCDNSEPEPSERGVLPRLGALTSQLLEASLFLPWEEGMSVSPSLSSSEEGIPISPDEVSGVPLEWGHPGPSCSPLCLPLPTLDMVMEPASLLTPD